LALRWYRLAAEQGNPTAQCNLGFAYARGHGVARAQAHTWFNVAGAQGDEVTSRNRDIVATNMTDEEIAEAQKLPRGWKPASVVSLQE